MLFFLRALQKQKAQLERKLARERLLCAALPALSAYILDLVRQHGRITLSEIQRLSGAKRSTIKLHMRKLVEDGQLSRHGQGRSTWYTLGE